MITIMLVDDHAAVRDALRVLLEMQPDFRVVGDAVSGREAISRAGEYCPDVMILDISLPDLNGIEILPQIKQICPTSRVIVLSMHTANNYVIQALQAGAHGYLLKAASGNEVINAVRVVQSGQHYLSQKVVDPVIRAYLVQPETASKTPLGRLSPREREVLQLVVEGKSSAEIANLLLISSDTVDTYRSRLRQKLGISDLPSLVKFAIQQGLISLE